MRPQSIIYFERIIFATILLGLLQSYLGWDRLVALAGTVRPNPVAFILTTQILSLGFYITLTLLVSRRRSKVAMWISLALFLLGIPAVFRLIVNELFVGSRIITFLQTVGEIVAYGLLFTRSARLWMKGKNETETKLKDIFS